MSLYLIKSPQAHFLYLNIICSSGGEVSVAVVSAAVVPAAVVSAAAVKLAVVRMVVAVIVFVANSCSESNS